MRAALTADDLAALHDACRCDPNCDFCQAEDEADNSPGGQWLRGDLLARFVHRRPRGGCEAVRPRLSDAPEFDDIRERIAYHQTFAHAAGGVTCS